MTIVLVILGLIILAFLGAPLYLIISTIALLAFFSAQIDSSAIIVELYRIASAPMLIAIPLFTFAGYVLAKAKTAERLINLTRALLGWMPGGLAIVSLIACAVFTAFTGASGVTIAALGGFLLPVLISEMYPERFAMGLMTAAGSLGLLFPPSLPIILYGVFAKVSIDKLFIAGILPGIFLIVVLSLFTMGKGRTAIREPFTWQAVTKSFRAAVWEIPIPFLVLGGIYGGFVTTTEAAALTAFYAVIVEVFIYKDIDFFKGLPKVVLETTVLVGGIKIILGCALGLTSYLVDAQVPLKLLNFMEQYVTSQTVFLILINLFLLMVGMMMDIFSAIIVVVPMIVPVAMAFNVNPVHLGIIFLTNLEIGYLMPPMGINLVIASLRFNIPIVKLYRAALPFIGILVIALLIITYLPQMSLFLVDLLGVK